MQLRLGVVGLGAVWVLEVKSVCVCVVGVWWGVWSLKFGVNKGQVWN